MNNLLFNCYQITKDLGKCFFWSKPNLNSYSIVSRKVPHLSSPTQNRNGLNLLAIISFVSLLLRFGSEGLSYMNTLLDKKITDARLEIHKEATEILREELDDKKQEQPEEPVIVTDKVNEGEAISLIEKLYYLLSEKKFNEARTLYSHQLYMIFPDDFFSQFKRVTVEDLQITSRTNNSINFTGKNTLVWFDGSTQREMRSYTVRNIDGELKITSSGFIKVIKLR